ncbi:hypothetical protein DVK85_03115 [Flavobacterium arcticum]|uniref:Uncharacterized protein n=1 Tax=Flavobacterium arcticum TaxID=1784713 RepID=A0A345H9K9_9FLAO|nr:hypothetical protein [Flavobacterium arcticum]AXG73269.1 hypothetical protein DVK85_03115 [Flavobacterium arcticum]KAF2513065.1 hypothetical protein E0W72_01185 [Flavobacterium arcticum]
MKNIIAFFICLTFSISQGQNKPRVNYDPSSTEYKEYYTTLLDMYKKMYDSELGIKVYQARENFRLKANYNKSFQDEKYQSLSGEEMALAWVEDHLEQTEFESMDEARSLFNKQTEMGKQLIWENIDLYKYSKEAMQVCGSEIMADVWKELHILYGSNRFMY